MKKILKVSDPSQKYKIALGVLYFATDVIIKLLILKAILDL